MRWPNTGAPTSIMDEKPLTPAARAGLVVNAAITILLFYLTAILFMAGFWALPPLLPWTAGRGGPAAAGPGRPRLVRGPRPPSAALRAGPRRASRPRDRIPP